MWKMSMGSTGGHSRLLYAQPKQQEYPCLRKNHSALSREKYPHGCGCRDVIGCRPVHAISLGKTVEDIGDKGWLVALSSVRDGSHIGRIGLKDDSVEGHNGWESRGEQ